jgi:hypothetical protein
LIADVNPDSSKTRRAAPAVVCLALLCLSGCRLTDVWSGVRTQSSGRSVELAAKTPLCGCLTFENRTDQPVFIESSLDDATTGSAVVPARSFLGQRFDWAGAQPDDFYILKAWTGQGSQLRFGTDVTFSVSPWEDCAKAACAFEPMMMDVGLTGTNPGDR